MPYVHGVKTSEVPTSLLPPVQSSAGIPFVVGMAPVNMTDPTNVNKPVLCLSYAEAVAAHRKRRTGKRANDGIQGTSSQGR